MSIDFSPFVEGHAAALAGHSHKDNPHTLYGKRWVRWMNGFQAGSVELARERAKVDEGHAHERDRGVGQAEV